MKRPLIITLFFLIIFDKESLGIELTPVLRDKSEFLIRDDYANDYDERRTDRTFPHFTNTYQNREEMPDENAAFRWGDIIKSLFPSGAGFKRSPHRPGGRIMLGKRIYRNAPNQFLQ